MLTLENILAEDLNKGACYCVIRKKDNVISALHNAGPVIGLNLDFSFPC